MSGPTDPSEAHFDKGTWGFDGTQWRKLDMLWGYTDRYAVQQNDESNVDDWYTVNLPGPASGEIWTLYGVAVYRSTNAEHYARVCLATAATYYSLGDVEIPLVGKFYPFPAEIVLKYGDNIRVYYEGATDGEALITVSWGYKMSVAS